MKVRNGRGEIEDHGPLDARSFSDPRKSDRQRKQEARESWLRRKFNLTASEYDEMLRGQGGVCAICGQPERLMRQGRTRRLAIDHDHQTGRVRGLLCASCNVVLGHLRDDPEWAATFVARMTTYLDPENTVFRGYM